MQTPVIVINVRVLRKKNVSGIYCIKIKFNHYQLIPLNSGG